MQFRQLFAGAGAALLVLAAAGCSDGGSDGRTAPPTTTVPVATSSTLPPGPPADDLDSVRAYLEEDDIACESPAPVADASDDLMGLAATPVAQMRCTSGDVALRVAQWDAADFDVVMADLERTSGQCSPQEWSTLVTDGTWIILGPAELPDDAAGQEVQRAQIKAALKLAGNATWTQVPELRPCLGVS